MRAVVSDAGWLLFGQVLGRGCYFLAGMFVGTYMGAEVFARLGYLSLTAAVFATIASLGAGTGLTRYAAAAEHVSGNVSAARFAAALLIGSLGCASAMLLTVFLREPFLPQAVEDLRLPLAIAIGAQVMSTLALGALLGQQKFRVAAMSSIASGFVLLGAVLLGVAIASSTLVLWSIPLSQLAYLLLSTRPLLRSFREIISAQGLGTVRSEIPAVFAFVAPMLGITVLAAAGPWGLGTLLVDRDRIEFAAYSAAIQWFSLVLVLPSALTNAFLPRVFREASQKAAASGGTELHASVQSAWAAGAIALATAAALLPMAGWLTELHGEVLRGRTGMLSMFFAAAVLVAPANALGNGLIARGGQVKWMGLTAAWLLILLGGAWFFDTATGSSAGLVLCMANGALLLAATWASLRTAAR